MFIELIANLRYLWYGSRTSSSPNTLSHQIVHRGFVVAVTGREGTPQVLVVASQRDGSTHSHAHTQRSHSLDPQDMPPSEGCCRAAVPLLLVLLLTGFLLLSGFLFYFNSEYEFFILGGFPIFLILPVFIGIVEELIDTIRE